MDYQALKDEILSGPLAAECVDKSDDEIAVILNDHKFTMVKMTTVNARQLMALLGPVIATTILDKLESVAAVSSPVKWAMKFLEQEAGLDIGHVSTRGQIDALVAGNVLTAIEGQTLKDLALQPASRAEIIGIGSVTANDCGTALRGI